LDQVVIGEDNFQDEIVLPADFVFFFLKVMSLRERTTSI